MNLMFRNMEMKNKIMLSKEQKILLEWLCHHTTAHGTAYSTWQMLFNERESETPDICIVIYENLTIEEKINVELIFARFIAITLNTTQKKKRKLNDWIDYLSYKEV